MTSIAAEGDAQGPAKGPDEALADSADASLRIGDLAKATGKSARALRLYEEMGLLTPGTRTAGGFRVYGEDAVARVRWIATQQDLGFTLHEVQALIEQAAAAGVPREAMAEVRRRYQAKLDEVSTQMQRLAELKAELTESLAYLEACTACPAETDGPGACATCSSHDEEAPALVQGVTLSAAESAPSRDPGLVSLPGGGSKENGR